MNWASVVGVAGRTSAGTLRIQTPQQVKLLGYVARAPALVRLLQQVVRLNARSPERLTELDLPTGALSRAQKPDEPVPNDTALSRVDSPEGEANRLVAGVEEWAEVAEDQMQSTKGQV